MASDLLFGVNREISNWQILLFSLALYLVYLCSILYVFQRRLKSIRSILMGISVILIMLSFEGFGLLRFNSSNYATTTDTQTVLTNSGLANQHFLSTYDHSTFFMLLTIILTVIAWMRFIALDNLFTCLFYSIIFGFISTKAMINWAFPYHMLVSHQFHHHHRHGTNNQEVYYYPFFFLFILKVLNTFISLWNPKNSSHSITFTYIFPLLYLITLLWPFMNLIISYILLENQDIDGLLAEMREREDIGASAGRESFTSSLPTITNKYTIYTGIILSTLIGNLTLTGSFRLKEVLNYMNDPRETIYSSRIMISFLYPFSSHTATTAAAAGSSIRSHGYSIVLFNCFITILWAFIVIAFQITSIDYDLFFPVICAIILIYDNEIEVNRIPFFSTLLQWFITKKKKVTPLHLWTLLIVAFWYASWFYHIFIMDLPLFTNTSSEDINASYFKHLAYLINLKPYSWMNFDSNVSIWSTEHWITPTLTIIYGIFTIPAIYYSIWNATSYAVKKTNQYTTEMTGTVSDDVLFLLSLFALIPVIGGHIDCLRYLGLIGGIYGIYRSNYLFRKEKLSSQYL